MHALLIFGLLLAPPARAAALSGAPQIESRFRLLIRKAFPQAEIQNDGGDERSYRFQVFDEKNGYARVIGPFEGYQDFFLIGKLRDRLISVEYACGPACEQRVTVYRFGADAAPVRIPLMDFLDLSGFDAVRRRLMNLCLDSEGDFDTLTAVPDMAHRQTSACPFVFSFPKKKKNPAARLFKVLDENGSDLLLSVGKTKVSPELTLDWVGGKLVGAEPRSAGFIFLDDEKMRALF